MVLEGRLDIGNGGNFSQQVAAILQNEVQQILQRQEPNVTWRPESTKQPAMLIPRNEPADARSHIVPTAGDSYLPITFNNLYPTETSSFSEAPGDRNKHSPAVTIKEFPDAAKRVLEKVDADHNGQITKAELAKAMENNKITGPDAQVLAALYRNFDQLQNLSNHKGLLEMPSITAGDIDKFKMLPPFKFEAAATATELHDWSHDKMPRFDPEHKGFISKANIEDALHNPNVSREDKKMLQFTHEHFAQIEKSGKGDHHGVSPAQVDDYVKSRLLADDQTEMIRRIMRTCDRVNNAESPNPRSLFADAKDPLSSIRPEAVRQGAIGDCYFASVVAGMANTDEGRERLYKMMHQNPDGTCTVTFPGAPKEPITVKAPTQAELGLYNGGSPYGTWASVLEKAAGEYATRHPKKLAQVFDHMPQEGISRGGHEGWSIQLLTGHKSSDYMLHANSQDDPRDVMPKHEIANALGWALKTHPAKVVVASTECVEGSEATEDGFPRDHSYTIVGFTPGGPGGGQVVIRNPWAVSNGSTEGQVSITLDKFIKNFKDMTFEHP